MNSPEFGYNAKIQDEAELMTFNFTYVLIINLITTAIISGIIIDTFSAMREQKEALDDDDNNNCFICCISRDKYERLGIPFETHR